MSYVSIFQLTTTFWGNGPFDTKYPNKLEGIVSRAEFSILVERLNKYRVYSKFLFLYIFFIIAGFGMLLTGSALLIENKIKIGSNPFYGFTSIFLIKHKIGIIFISIGLPEFILGIVLTAVYNVRKIKVFIKRINKELDIINEKYYFKSRSIVCTLDHEKSVQYNHDYFRVKVSFSPNVERIVDPSTDYLQYYPSNQNPQIPITTTQSSTTNHQLQVETFSNDANTTYFNYNFSDPSSSSPTLSIPSTTKCQSSQPLERDNIEMNAIECEIEIDIDNEPSNY